MTVVSITQPSAFPWLGLFEKLAHSDTHVVLEDVNFQKKGYLGRMRLKSPSGPRWVTVPLENGSSSVLIYEVRPSTQQWLDAARRRLLTWYEGAPYRQDAVGLLEEYDLLVRGSGLVHAAMWTMTAVADYTGLPKPTFIPSSTCHVTESKSARLVALVRAVGGTTYLYGLGSATVGNHYLDRELFERNGIALRTMSYEDREYPQLHGPFASRLSVLDGIALCGPQIGEYCLSLPT